MDDAVTRHPLAHRDGINLVAAILYVSGDLCPECGYATRTTSKRWARCKRCPRTRIPRRSLEDAVLLLRPDVTPSSPRPPAEEVGTQP